MAEKTKVLLTPGKDTFTLYDLIGKAAEYKSLKLDGIKSSEPMASYTLDEKLLAFLAKRNIKQQPRPDVRHNIFTLVDGGWQEKYDGVTPSNYWNFKRKDREDEDSEFDLRVTLSVKLNLNIEQRGVEFWPQAHGTFLSAGSQTSNFRMFQALVESGGEVLEVAKEIAASDGHIVVTWTDLGLGGIRRMSDLFKEFNPANSAVDGIAVRGEVFDPQPYLHAIDNVMFIAEPAQPRTIAAWRAQLKEYKTSLVA